MFRFTARVRTHPRFFPRFRIGLKIQIALLGILGVLFTGAVCLVGLNLAAMTQLESDQSVNLRMHVLGLSANYLEAGQIATEFLILGLDPYPRKPDAMFQSPAVGEDSAHPFAALAGLKKRQRGEEG